MDSTRRILFWLVPIFVLLVTTSSVDLDLKPLKVSAFNVRIFGRTKMSKPEVVETLCKIVLRYDIILIQEIRDSSETAIYSFLDYVNRRATTGSYSLVVSGRLGRSSSKEQYAFIYRNDLVSVISQYTYDDGDESQGTDTFQREPFIVRFNSPTTGSSKEFYVSAIKDFACAAIHTSPSAAVEETDALVTVYDDIIREWSLHDVMIMGDFNAACSYVRDSDWPDIKLATDKRFYWLITECFDTTVGGGMCTYDRFVIAGDAMKEAVVRGSGNTFRFDKEYGLDQEAAFDVSDHYPIEMKIHDTVYNSIKSYITFEREVNIKDSRVTGLSKRFIYSLRKDTNPLSSAKGFSLRKHKRFGGVLNIILEKTLASEDEAVQAVGTIHECYPAVVTEQQVKSTRNSIRTLASYDPLDSFPYQTLPESRTSISQYKVGLVCEVTTPNSCWINVMVELQW